MADIGRQFMLETTYPYLEESDQSKGLPQPPLAFGADPSQPTIELPDPARLDVPPVSLRALIEQRQTLRSYARVPLSLAELSYLLWCTQGVKAVTDRPATLRTVPSAGARHAFETYLLANRVDGLEPGLYRYLALDHRIAPVNLESGVADAMTDAALAQKHVKNSAVTFAWVAVVYRMAWRYVERGYRYLHLDAGHVCQNLYLAAESIGCGVCAVGAFDDEAMNRMLGVSGEDQFVIYMGTVGKKK
jgi:SagB-type dehydrogenase family enzyme